jgi:hypothetical protein
VTGENRRLAVLTVGLDETEKPPAVHGIHRFFFGLLPSSPPPHFRGRRQEREVLRSTLLNPEKPALYEDFQRFGENSAVSTDISRTTEDEPTKACNGWVPVRVTPAPKPTQPRSRHDRSHHPILDRRTLRRCEWQRANGPRQCGTAYGQPQSPVSVSRFSRFDSEPITDAC